LNKRHFPCARTGRTGDVLPRNSGSPAVLVLALSPAAGFAGLNPRRDAHPAMSPVRRSLLRLLCTLTLRLQRPSHSLQDERLGLLTQQPANLQLPPARVVWQAEPR